MQRRLSLEITIDEKNEGSYGYTKVASHNLTVNLPVDPETLAEATQAIYIQLLTQAALFGSADVVSETKVEN